MIKTLAVFAVFVAAPAMAQDGPLYERQSVLQIFTNDWIGMPVGDRFDRWRTGGFQVSGFWSQDRSGGALPSSPFDLLEIRLRGEIIAPDNLAAPAPGDRLYAPALYFGASTHFDLRGFEISAGADLAVTGEQTRLMELHDRIHRTFGGSDVDLSDFTIADGLFLNATFEGARRFGPEGVEIRPFVEAQAGVETLARVGADFRFGNFDASSFLVREPITGQRITAIAGESAGGWSFSAGADAAWVADSVLLPGNGPAAEDVRYRLRGAIHYDAGIFDFSYGITYLSEEFVGQEEGQLVGSLSAMLRF